MEPLDERGWERVQRARPGEVVLLSAASGGYSETLGWTGEPEDKPQPFSVRGRRLDGYSDDPRTFQRRWETLREHTRAVIQQMNALATALNLEPDLGAALQTAATWHDVGKAHVVFQEMRAPHQRRSSASFRQNQMRTAAALYAKPSVTN